MFTKATKEKLFLRMAIDGPAGSGKTFTGLLIGQALAELAGGRLAVLDSEAGNAKKYADQFDFDHAPIGDEGYSPELYTHAIKAAVKAGHKVILLDSLSHAWAATGGALDQADKGSVRTGNKFTAWREVTPKHNTLVETILTSPIHVLATMRSKMEYVQEKDDRGKTAIRKIGLAPVQREGMEYEFDVIGSMDMDNVMVVTKSRCSAIHGQVIRKPGADLAGTLYGWLSSGVEAAPRLPSLLRNPHTSEANSDSEEIAIVAALKDVATEEERVGLVPRIKALAVDAQKRVKPKYVEAGQRIGA